MSLGVGIDGLRYKESTTPNGNPYHECRTFRNAGILAPICTGACIDSFTGIAIAKGLEKCKLPVEKYKGLTTIVGILVDVLIFYGIGKFIDKIITKHRLVKADKLAEKQN